MPKNPINYTKSIIYRLEHIDKPELFYIGATTDFTRRKYQHKRRTLLVKECPKSVHSYMYNIMDKTGGWDNYRMSPIKEISCENSTQLRIEEYKMITELRPTLNSQLTNNNLINLITKLD